MIAVAARPARDALSSRAMGARYLLSAWLLIGAALVPAPASAQSDGSADTDARAVFDDGRRAYDEGRFEDATRAFRRAYLLSARYQLLYNIGQSELRAGHDAQALQAFEAFLRHAGADDPQRAEVEERVRVLRSMGVESAPDPTTTETTTTTTTSTTETTTDTPPPPPRDEGPGVVPWILVIGGGAAIVAGAVLMGVGVSESSRVTGATDGMRWADLEGSASSANVLWGTGIALAAVGLAATGVGLVWALSGGSGSSEGGATARLRIGPSGLGVQGEF